MYGRIVHSHLFCQAAFISPPIHPSPQRFIHPSIYPSVHLYTRSLLPAFGLVFSSLPILLLLSHSFLEATHLFICPSIHPSSLSHPSISSFTHPLIHPACMCMEECMHTCHLPTHLVTPRLSIQPFLHFLPSTSISIYSVPLIFFCISPPTHIFTHSSSIHPLIQSGV